MQIAKAIDEPQLEPPNAAPELAGEQLVFGRGELGPTTRFHPVDEDLMDVGLERLDALDVFGLFGKERVHCGLVLAGGVNPTLNAQLVERARESEAGEDDADRSNDRRRIGDDLVAGGGDEVAAGRGGVFNKNEHALATLGREIAEALGDEARLDR